MNIGWIMRMKVQFIKEKRKKVTVRGDDRCTLSGVKKEQEEEEEAKKKEEEDGKEEEEEEEEGKEEEGKGRRRRVAGGVEEGSFLTVLTDDGEQSKWPIAPGSRSCNASDLVCVASVISWCIFHKANHREKRLKGTHLVLFPENYAFPLSFWCVLCALSSRALVDVDSCHR